MVKEDERQHKQGLRERLREEHDTMRQLEQLATESGLPSKIYIQLHRADALLQETSHSPEQEEQYREDYFFLAQAMDSVMQGREHTIRSFEVFDELYQKEFYYKDVKVRITQAVTIDNKTLSIFVQNYFKLAGIGCLTPECVAMYERTASSNTPIAAGEQQHSNRGTRWANSDGDIGSGATSENVRGFISLRMLKQFHFSNLPRILPYMKSTLPPKAHTS